MHSFLEAHCPIFSEKFWPTIWCIEARAQTVIGSVFAKHMHVPYERYVLTVSVSWNDDRNIKNTLVRARCTDFTKWLSVWLTIWLSVCALQEALTVG